MSYTSIYGMPSWYLLILARGPLLKLMEQVQSGFGLLQDEEKFIRIMLHVNADSRVGKSVYMICSWTEHEFITIVVEYLIVSKLGSDYYVN